MEKSALESDGLSTDPDLGQVTYYFYIYKIGILIIIQSTPIFVRGFHELMYVEQHLAHNICSINLLLKSNAHILSVEYPDI